jgi:integrase
MTELEIKALKKRDIAYRVTDSDGLVLEVTPAGSKIWRLRYRYLDERVVYTLGEYPAISLKQARLLRDQAKALLAIGVDPRQKKEEQLQQQLAEREAKKMRVYTFKQAFLDWFDFKAKEWSLGYFQDVEGRARIYLLPQLGDIPLNEIKTKDCIAALKKIEATGRLGAMAKCKTILTSLFKYHVSYGNIEFSPMVALDNSILQKAERKNFAHVTTPREIQDTFNKLAAPYKGSDTVHDAAILLALTFLRASEAARIKWEYIDIEHNLIRLPASEMKMNREHLVPISKQVQAILDKRQEVRFQSDYVFYSPTDLNKPINAESMRKVLRLQGIEKDVITSHGWRHSASTWLHEQGFDHWAIESQLSHSKDGVHAAYDKSQHLKERIKLMQAWADFLMP